MLQHYKETLQFFGGFDSLQLYPSFVSMKDVFCFFALNRLFISNVAIITQIEYSSF